MATECDRHVLGAALTSCSGRIVATRDVTRAQDGLSRHLWPQALRVTDPDGDQSGFHARLSRHDLGGLTLSHVEFGNAEVISTLRGDPGHPAVLIHVPAAGQVEIWTGRDHATCAGDTVVVTHPGQVVLARWDPGASGILVTVPTQLLADALCQLTGRVHTPTPRLAPVQHRLRAWVDLVHAVHRAATTGTTAHPTAARHYRAALVTGLLTGADHDHDALIQAATAGVDARVHAALTWIDTHHADPIGVTDIARAAGMAPRTLHRLFTGQIGLSPICYLHRVRLVHVREALLAADPATSISRLAATAGFTSRGWLTSLYQRVYGETPTDTLRRHTR